METFKRISPVIVLILQVFLISLLVFRFHWGRRAESAANAAETAQAMELQRTTCPATLIAMTFDGIEFVWIPPGSFMMGSGLSAEKLAVKYGGWEAAYEDEYPQHSVRISRGFWMSKYEVTNAQYRKYKSSHLKEVDWQYILNGDSQPVVEVSWNDATAYCEWLSQRSNAIYRLPTEAEWEYACRAGTSTPRYWGDDDAPMGLYANVYDRTGEAEFNFPRPYAAAETTDGYKVTAPVGSFEPNAWGLHDMIGNVSEWCGDWYGEYSAAWVTDPGGPVSGIERIVRGASWIDSGPTQCRSAKRERVEASDVMPLIGFRICRSVDE